VVNRENSENNVGGGNKMQKSKIKDQNVKMIPIALKRKLTSEEQEKLICCIQRDFLVYVIDREYTRGIFRDLGLSETEIFGLLELLGLELEKKQKEACLLYV